MATVSICQPVIYGNTSFYDQVFNAREDKEIRIVLAGKTGEGNYTLDSNSQQYFLIR